MAEILDKHHLWYPRIDYSTGYCKSLRNHWYFIVDIPRETIHNRIHKEIPVIPTPSGLMAREICEEMTHLELWEAIHDDDPLEKRMRLLVMLLAYVEEETAVAMKKQLDIISEFQKETPLL